MLLYIRLCKRDPQKKPTDSQKDGCHITQMYQLGALSQFIAHAGRNLQKRPTKEAYNCAKQNRCHATQMYQLSALSQFIAHAGQIFKRDPQKRPTKEDYTFVKTMDATPHKCTRLVR